MKLLKVTTHDLMSPTKQGFQYVIGRKETCHDFDESNNECSRGFYATGIDGLIYTYRPREGHRVFECEVGGKRKDFNQFKRRFEEFTLLDKELSHDDIKQLALDAEHGLGYRLSEALFPINPFELPERDVTDIDIEMLKQWASVVASVVASVGASVWDSVVASVGASVVASVGASVGASVWDSVGASVWDSVGAYIGGLFPNIAKWKHIDHVAGEYPFQSCVDLWKTGLVPSFDGKIWRLHSGSNAKVVYEMRIDK